MNAVKSTVHTSNGNTVSMPSFGGRFESPSRTTETARTAQENGWMTRAVAKGNEKIEVSKGTLVALGLVASFLTLVLSYGGSFVGVVRDDQTQKMQLQQVQSDVNDLKTDIREIKTSLTDREKTEAYKLGMAAAEPESSPAPTPTPKGRKK